MSHVKTMSLGDWYRRNGESLHVNAVEGVLTDKWQTRRQIADKSGKHYNYVSKVLDYLVEEGRAEQQEEKLKKAYYGQKFRYVYRSKNFVK